MKRNILAGTIMIADSAYEELKHAKGADKSFSDMIPEAGVGK
jgi:predicted CopG family antitoxin